MSGNGNGNGNGNRTTTLAGSLAFWLAFVPLLPQALWVRRRARRFDGAPGPRSGSVGQGETLKLVGLGDSIIAGVGCTSLERAMIGATATALAARTAGRIEWHAHGRSGLHTDAIRRRLLPDAELNDADFVLVSTGVNDVTRLNSPTAFEQELGNLLATIEQRAPRAFIAINGVPPMQCFPALPTPLNRALGLRARQLDRVLENVSTRYQRVVRVPLPADLAPEKFAPDGYHPSEASCSELADVIAEALLALKRPLSPPAPACAGRA
ncbi:MAG: SGNH/GDSL hydrolase family protein [Wenzhouxiangellaceae bacterium]|nr:SGNH/GDSL hydrolase family protein [Wenzhouxiangellaceae bacterium]